jgi:Vacuolar sorting protein 39 domain 2
LLASDLSEWEKAEEYCNKFYTTGSAVYEDLFENYKETSHPIEATISYLNKYGSFINAKLPLSFFQHNVTLSKIKPFLIRSLKHQTLKRSQQAVVENVSRAQILSLKNVLYEKQAASVVINDGL